MKTENLKSEYLNVLTDMGLRPQEAKVYLACLKLGQSTVGRISEEAGVQRTFVYDILKDLQEKGTVSWIERRGKRHYSSVSIETFKNLQQEKFRRFVGLVPEIKALEMTVGDRPKVLFFEGAEGIKSALQDTLDLPRGSEILAFANARGFWEDEQKFASEYIRKRVHKGIDYRSIMPDISELEEYIKKDEKHKRITRLVPADKFGFTNEINIYGSKMLIMSLQGELLAVIIESESVAKTQRMIFELAWEGAAKISASKVES